MVLGFEHLRPLKQNTKAYGETFMAVTKELFHKGSNMLPKRTIKRTSTWRLCSVVVADTGAAKKQRGDLSNGPSVHTVTNRPAPYFCTLVVL